MYLNVEEVNNGYLLDFNGTSYFFTDLKELTQKLEELVLNEFYSKILPGTSYKIEQEVNLNGTKSKDRKGVTKTVKKEPKRKTK